MFDDEDRYRRRDHHSTQLVVDMLQNTLRDTQLDMARLSEQVRLQRKVIEKLVQLLADSGEEGKRLLQDKEIREFLRLAPAQAGSGRVIGKLRCPECNSMVEDKEGVTNVK
mgnify:CR=1 FL=1